MVKNSTSSRPVPYPPAMIMDWKQNPGRRNRENQRERSGFFTARERDGSDGDGLRFVAGAAAGEGGDRGYGPRRRPPREAISPGAADGNGIIRAEMLAEVRSRRKTWAVAAGLVASGLGATLGAAAPAFREPAPAARQEPSETGEASPESLVDRWFLLANDLDRTPASREEFLALYEEDALHIQGPAGGHQRGTATYWGREKIASMLERLLAEWKDFALRLVVATARETSEAVWPSRPGPWGGPLVAAEFTVAGTRTDDGKRWTVPGAVFFRLREGRILRTRLYLGLGEAAEVEIQR